ncbi:NAD+ kinase [Halorubrum aquaticum]|uniref:NAD+ kinase n=1 Tax=Halorubrum aquaticum TaxID=387340 RepID=A0A1I3CYM5_9EURY|nr:NAD(+)/NADH kinase [Halorubrum aquaticum]SFH79585.1 NAD+ kinase [Halorubrum aquaticum]
MGDPVSRVAVVGADESLADRAERAVRAAGGRTDEPAASDAIVAVGDEAIRDALVDSASADHVGSVPPERVDAPVLPVREGRHAVDPADLRDAIRGLFGGETRRVGHPVLSVDLGGDTVHRAVFDVGFVTDEPARISEYAVDLAVDREAAFRADGVVVATPLGSDGYAAAAGGPLLEAGSGIAVVPIAPFTTRSDTWVVPDGTAVSVRRDAETVSIVVDGDRRGTVTPGRPVRIEVVDRVETLRLPRPHRPKPSADRKGSNNS